MLYDRKIKYVHMYENDEKIQNVGFVKLESMEGKAKIYVQIAGIRLKITEECVVMAKGNGTEAALGKLRLENGKGSLDIKGLATEQMAEGISFETLQELYMNIQGGAKLRCVIRENMEEVPQENKEELTERICDEKQENHVMNLEHLSEAELLREAFVQERYILEEPVPVKASPQIMQVENTEVSPVMAADKWQQLWNLYPHIRPFEDEREYLAIKPIDLVILQNQYYTLSANSFLLHGYYNYEHLVLCRETKRDEDVFYIGAPGNFYEKEKRVAVLFGFESFEGKKEPAGTGDFGYYMVRVEI